MTPFLISILIIPNLVIALTTAMPNPNFEKTLIDLEYNTGGSEKLVLTANIIRIYSLNISNKNIKN